MGADRDIAKWRGEDSCRSPRDPGERNDRQAGHAVHAAGRRVEGAAFDVVAIGFIYANL